MIELIWLISVVTGREGDLRMPVLIQGIYHVTWTDYQL